MSNFDRLRQLYETGSVPWDQPAPPPEVTASLAGQPAGRALDLGCGLGRAALYLASQGWSVDGVDFIPQAVTEAQARAERAGLAAQAVFHQGSVTDLSFLAGPYDFALDVGCAHGLEADGLRAYHRELLRLLRGGALYLLFAHLNDDQAGPEAQRWLDEAGLRRLFSAGFALDKVEHGQTQVGDQPPWPSAWFWFRRTP
ncbi:MAG: class I SAM-dependent methyltransferase [Anaerolineales bacterium]|nr:class I SAM-dependent methyltransferase [Anaerolineales bacterium]